MPLIGRLSSDPNLVVCGVDRLVGREGKPVVLIATLGFHAKKGGSETTILAPAQISEILPKEFRVDIQNIMNRFKNIHSGKRHEWIKKSKEFWGIEMNWPKQEEKWEV